VVQNLNTTEICRGQFRWSALGAIPKFYYGQGEKLLEAIVQLQLDFYICMGNGKIERAREIAGVFCCKNWIKIML